MPGGDRPGTGRIGADGPDIFAAIAIAHEVNAMITGPTGNETRGGAIGESLAAAAIGVDDPDVLLPARLAFVGLGGIDHSGERQALAIGAPAGADDGGVGADRNFGNAAGFAVNQVQGPEAEPAAAALASALEGDAVHAL